MNRNRLRSLRHTPLDLSARAPRRPSQQPEKRPRHSWIRVLAWLYCPACKLTAVETTRGLVGLDEDGYRKSYMLTDRCVKRRQRCR